MVSAIDPTKPVDGLPAGKADLRANLQAAKSEIEELQTDKADAGHQHVLGDITDAGTLAGLDQVGASEIAPDALDGRPINMQDQLLTRPEIRDFAETTATPAVAGGTLTLDLETANVFEVVLTGNVSTLVLSNPPATTKAGSVTLILRQDATGNRTFSWPGSTRWAGGSPPVVSAAANAVDVYGLITRDGGTTWYGFIGGKAFS